MATYNFAFTPGSIDEGSSQSFLINSNDGDFTTPVTLYWTTTGGTATVSDFSANTGSFSIAGNAIYGQGSFSVAAYADSLTEGTETFQVQIRTGSIGGTIVATSNVVTILDTSKAPLIPITLTANSLYFDGDVSMTGVKIQFVK